MTHVEMVEDSRGDLVDIRYACSAYCARELGFPKPSAWPGGMETDSDVFCERCESHMWHGLDCDSSVYCVYEDALLDAISRGAPSDHGVVVKSMDAA
jgi:hypothetical protein